ncbi:hypothetical protein [Thermosporothrix hazakensis]|nr:hypothetical protein [Thermosporothrix hazakensis]
MDIFIKDTAKILESDRVQQEAAKLPYHVLLYTAKELPKSGRRPLASAKGMDGAGS